ncbi:MAG: NUDIX hydrolase [Clostridia bacterium]|nr:NUDIX hydrolase [Clostridia bacterium]
MESKKIVIGIVKNGEDVLIIKRAKKEQDLIWGFPGGKIELGELPEEALVREVKEETNLDCRIFKSITKRAHPVHDIEILSYSLEVISGEIKILNISEIEEVKWINKKDISKYLKNIDEKVMEEVLR